MSEEAVVVPNPASGVDALSAGALLRNAREATGLHVAALAVAMKVPVKKLEALEADRYDELLDAVFIRALAGSVCRTLKVDAAPILAKLPQSVVPKLDRSERGVSLPQGGSGFLAANSLAAFATRPAVLLVAVLLLAALAVVFIPEARNTVGLSGAAKAVPAESAPAQSAAESAVPMAAVTMASDKPVAPDQEASAPVALPAVVAAPAALATPTRAASAVAASGAEATPAASGVLVFKAKERAWVRVSDSKGSIQFEKTLAAGESAAASGTLPLSVVLGNAAGTEVLLRGQPFGLDALTQNNVARFEVK